MLARSGRWRYCHHVTQLIDGEDAVLHGDIDRTAAAAVLPTRMLDRTDQISRAVKSDVGLFKVTLTRSTARNVKRGIAGGPDEHVVLQQDTTDSYSSFLVLLSAGPHRPRGVAVRE